MRGVVHRVCSLIHGDTEKRNTLYLCPLRVSVVPLLKPQRLDLNHVWEGADAVEDRRGHRLIDLHESDRVLPRGGAAEVEGRDVDFGSAERVPQRTDKARFVVIAHEQHVAAELCFERDALDRHDARLVAREQRAGELARATFTKGY